MNATKILTTLGIGVALAFAPQSAAQAHVTYAYHGKDWARVGDGHLHVDVRDNECDGNYTLARVDFNTSGDWDYEVWNLEGCGKTVGADLRSRVARFKMCEAGVGCSAWKQP